MKYNECQILQILMLILSMHYYVKNLLDDKFIKNNVCSMFYGSNIVSSCWLRTTHPRYFIAREFIVIFLVEWMSEETYSPCL